MSKWQILIIKEIKHLFRDTKTIVQTVVVPTFITPVLIGAIFWYISSIAQEETVKTYEIGFSGQTENQIYDDIADSERFTIELISNLEELKTSVQNDLTDIGIYLEEGLDVESSLESSGKINVFYKDLDTFSQAKDVLLNIIEDYPSASFIYRILGGLRGTKDVNKDLAIFLTNLDKYLVKKNIINANYFYAVAKKHKETS